MLKCEFEEGRYCWLLTAPMPELGEAKSRRHPFKGHGPIGKGMRLPRKVLVEGAGEIVKRLRLSKCEGRDRLCPLPPAELVDLTLSLDRRRYHQFRLVELSQRRRAAHAHARADRPHKVLRTVRP